MRNLSSPHTNILMWGSKVAILFFLLFAYSVQAVNSLNIVINEIAWMGTEISYNDEWIELYNNSDSPINLEGWILKTADGTPKINLTGTVAAKSFYLLERTDDNTVPDIPADQIYTGALGNTGEKLELYDGSGNLIDLVDCSSGWFAGDNKTKQTMERKNPRLEGSNPDNWATSQNPGGTPKAKNSLVVQTEPQSQTKPDESAQQPIIYPTGIVINEILPSPEGPDEEEEWIEIFNQNNFEIDLSGWQIRDTVGETKTYTFPQGKKISPQGFLVLDRPTSKITLNNDGDGLILLQPDGNIVDSVSYEKVPRGQSYNKINSKWVWSIILTSGAENVIPAQDSKDKEVKNLKEDKEIFTQKGEKEIKKELAAAGPQISLKPSDFLLVFLTGFTFSIFSAIIILILKQKLKKLIY